MRYYVYQWIRKDSNKPFYVGKGSQNRASHKKNNKGWVNITNKVDCFYEIIFYTDDEELAILYEHMLIDKYRFIGYKLVNQTKYSPGGSSWNYTDRVKAIQSKNRKGKGTGYRSQEWRDNISKANSGRNISWSDKIGDALRGVKKNYPNPNKKKIIQLSLNNEFIAEFDSATHAGLTLNKSGNSIADCASGRQKSAYGFNWKYKK